MQGHQLVKTATAEFSPYAIAELPNELRQKSKIRVMGMRGHTQSEKTYAANIKVASTEKGRQKRKRDVMSLDINTMKDKAKKAKTFHDTTWHNKEKRTYFDIVEKVATKSHFNSVLVADNAFTMRLRHYYHSWTLKR